MQKTYLTKEKLQQRNELYHWNKLFGESINKKTDSSLDYPAADLLATEISLLESQVVYDTNTLFSITLYQNPEKIFLNRRRILLHDVFPSRMRSQDLIYSERTRISFQRTFRFARFFALHRFKGISHPKYRIFTESLFTLFIGSKKTNKCGRR